MNEESTPANAGQVFFPARETRKQTAQVEASWISKKIRHDRDQLTTRKLQAPQTITVDMDGRVRESNQPPSYRTIISPFTQTIEQSPTPHTKPQKAAWEHSHEDKLRLLGGTPFYRSQAESAADYVHAWAMIGTAACALGFTEENNKDKNAHSTYVPEHLQKRTPPLTVWAGPFFEQAHLCSLNALDSYKCFSATLPGPNFFMQKNLQLKEGEQFLQYAKNPFENDSVLLPAGIHAHGKRNKELLVPLSHCGCHWTSPLQA